MPHSDSSMIIERSNLVSQLDETHLDDPLIPEGNYLDSSSAIAQLDDNSANAVNDTSEDILATTHPGNPIISVDGCENYCDGDNEYDDYYLDPLTIGIELEFLVPVLESGQEDPFPQDPRPLFRQDSSPPEEYRNALKKFVLSPLQATEGFVIRDSADDKYVPPEYEIPRYDVWRLVEDRSVKLKCPKSKEEQAFIWEGKEITSEVMAADDPSYRDKIYAICRGIRSARVHLNHTAGLHVHVGCGDWGFYLLELQKFASLLWLVDARLLALHHPCRRKSKFCRPLASFSRLSRYKRWSWYSWEDDDIPEGMMIWIPEDLPEDLHAIFGHIWGCTEPGELASLMMAPRECSATGQMFAELRGTVGFRRFLPFGRIGGNTSTLEFRQMAGCLDPDSILHWINVCVALVDYARKSNVDEFKGLVAEIVSTGETYTAFDLLRYLGLEDEVQFYERKVKGYEAATPKGLELFDGGANSLFLTPL
ncbi:hypothetical protein BX600DRAFT_436173 [Xylariales sp. PMI_506]|nr:hypothetical protein BX600DRAFT_436173 [Xylariales sp. PMI_506]